MLNKNSQIQYNKFICEFYREINGKTKSISNLVFLCIGTDRITGDCFGPIVGEKLQGFKNNISVYGSLEEPIIESNLKNKLEEIYLKFSSPFIIAIDAALSKEENIGKIFVMSDSLKLGKGLGKNIAQIGDVSIKGVVGKKERSKKKNMQILQNTSLNMVMNLADIVSNGIVEVLQEEYK